MGTRNRACVITGQRILRHSTYLSCACQRGPSQGWSVRRILLPYFYLLLLGWLESAHSFFLSFTRCIQTPWIFSCAGSSSVSDLDSLLRGLLRY